MVWKIKYLKSVQKNIRKIEHKERERVRKYLENQIANSDNPRRFGKALKGNQSEFWRYRVGDHRIICELNDISATILVIRIGHRKDVYKK